MSHQADVLLACQQAEYAGYHDLGTAHGLRAVAMALLEVAASIRELKDQ